MSNKNYRSTTSLPIFDLKLHLKFAVRNKNACIKFAFVHLIWNSFDINSAPKDSLLMKLPPKKSQNANSSVLHCFGEYTIVFGYAFFKKTFSQQVSKIWI